MHILLIHIIIVNEKIIDNCYEHLTGLGNAPCAITYDKANVGR